jgi:hypothetical protein
MIDFNTEIDPLIYDWTVLYSGIEVIWSNDNGPKPDKPYIALRRQVMNPIGEEYLSKPDSNGMAKISGNRDLIVYFQAYGDNAFGRLEDLWTTRLIPASQEFLATQGLSLVDRMAMSNITGLNDTKFEERAVMDLLFRFASQRVNVEVGLIESIEINGQYKEGNKTTNQTINIDL